MIFHYFVVIVSLFLNYLEETKKRYNELVEYHGHGPIQIWDSPVFRSDLESCDWICCICPIALCLLICSPETKQFSCRPCYSNSSSKCFKESPMVPNKNPIFCSILKWKGEDRPIKAAWLRSFVLLCFTQSFQCNLKDKRDNHRVPFDIHAVPGSDKSIGASFSIEICFYATFDRAF